MKNNPAKNGRLLLETDNKIKKIQCSLDISKKMCELSVNLNIINNVKELMGCDNIYLWEDKIHYKHSMIGSEYKWHCDYNNWTDSRSKDFITCMIFLEDTNEQNGCLKVIPGSNNEYDKYPTNKDKNIASTFIPGVIDRNVIDGRATFPDSINEEKVINICCNKGDVLFFDAFIQHSSGENKSLSSRKCIFLTYSPEKYGNLYMYNILRRNFNAFFPQLGCLPREIPWDKYKINEILSNTTTDYVDIAANRNTQKTLSYYDNLEKYLEYDSNQKILDIVRNFAKFTPRQSITNFISHYEIYKKILNIHGSVLEFGVLNGGSLFHWAHFSEILEPTNFLRKIYGFDTFSGFVEITKEDQQNQEEKQIIVGGFKSSYNAFDNIKKEIDLFDQNRFLGHMKKIDIIKGDVLETLPKFLNDNKELLISLVHMDLDLYKPTKFVIEQIFSRMSKGSIIIFDELNHPDYPGETVALLEKLNINNYKIQRLPISAGVSYMVI